MLTAIIFVFGLCVGSFLNVCVYRLPEKISIITPRSHCPKCKKTIAFFDNIPLLSYVFLGGKCRHCKTKISPLYFFIELLTALTMVLFYKFFGPTAHFLIYSALGCALIVVTFVDFKIQEIPDEISIPGMVIGLILSFIFPSLMRTELRFQALLASLLGLLAGGGSIYLMGMLGEAMFRKEAMGGGDVKLMAMVGAFVGWELAILAFFIAPFFGSVIGIISKIKDGKETIPYGPYLSMAAVIVILWGNKILDRFFFYLN